MAKWTVAKLVVEMDSRTKETNAEIESLKEKLKLAERTIAKSASEIEIMKRDIAEFGEKIWNMSDISDNDKRK